MFLIVGKRVYSIPMTDALKWIPVSHIAFPSLFFIEKFWIIETLTDGTSVKWKRQIIWDVVKEQDGIVFSWLMFQRSDSGEICCLKLEKICLENRFF